MLVKSQYIYKATTGDGKMGKLMMEIEKILLLLRWASRKILRIANNIILNQ
jgi:hypothetical protein